MIWLRQLTLLVSVLGCFAAGPVYAACTSPAGVEQQIIYNGDYHTYQYCNGTNWVKAGGQRDQQNQPESDISS